MLRSIVNRALNGGRGAATGRAGMGGLGGAARRRPSAGRPGMGTGMSGGRTHDEAIGRGVRQLFKRFR